MEHKFTRTIKNILAQLYGNRGADIYEKSLLIQYLNEKTKSASRGSKSRGSFASIYAIYVIVEDYLVHDFNKNRKYRKYKGAQFSSLFKRQRELPFGGKLQNHALNNRVNAEFQKFFPTSEIVPILRDLQTNRYWINENLLRVKSGRKVFNIAPAIIDIIDEYVKIKQDAFHLFIKQCEDLQNVGIEDNDSAYTFILGLLSPNTDARFFEIVSYSILKYFYKEQHIVWGYSIDKLIEEELKLYKTGRVNANDGGIDFVMRPLGRFFQVTETIDFRKYFLDIDKIERYPITFVVKSNESIECLKNKLQDDALKTYVVEDIVNKYMTCIEELINIPKLLECLQKLKNEGQLFDVLNEVLMQSKVEFNYEEN